MSVELFGAGIFVMADAKQINASEAFLGLADYKKGCQNEVTLEDCLMKIFLKDGMDACKCIPYSLTNYSTQEVIENRYYMQWHHNIFFKSYPCAMSRG